MGCKLFTPIGADWSKEEWDRFGASINLQEVNKLRKEYRKAIQALKVNPDPSKFEIMGSHQVGRFLLVAIRYIGCTHLEGNKYAIFADVTLDELKAMKSLDPHFQDGRLAPIIRIKPSKTGWELAVKMCNWLDKEYGEMI